MSLQSTSLQSMSLHSVSLQQNGVDPVLALREALLARLSGDAALVALLGGPRIYDEAPRGLTGVYAVFGEARVRDWSTGSDIGHEQELSIVVWSQPGGAKAALEAAGRIALLLDDVNLTLRGHRLVNLRLTNTVTRRDERANRWSATLWLRAVTETN